MNTKYDLIFGIGEACSCTSLLRENYLQFFSYPFDWLYGTNFFGRCKILANDFSNFINKEDLELSGFTRSINCNAYYNKHNDITFNHDFNKDIPFDEMYDTVSKKYQRRIERLLNNIKSSQDILIVYLETPTTDHIFVSDEEIINGFELIKNKYPQKNINLLYFTNSNDKNETIDIAENITRIFCSYKQNNPEFDYIVNHKTLKQYIRKFKLKGNLKRIVNMKIKKFFISFLPSKNLRRKLRKKFHIR